MSLRFQPLPQLSPSLPGVSSVLHQLPASLSPPSTPHPPLFEADSHHRLYRLLLSPRPSLLLWMQVKALHKDQVYSIQAIALQAHFPSSDPVRQILFTPDSLLLSFSSPTYLVLLLITWLSLPSLNAPGLLGSRNHRFLANQSLAILTSQLAPNSNSLRTSSQCSPRCTSWGP